MSIMDAHYTPGGSTRMAFLADHGVRRLHWIDYSDNPGFDRIAGWTTGLSRSRKACGPVLKAAAKAARKNGVEFIADFKVLDLGFNQRPIPFRKKDSVIGFDGLTSSAIPEMTKHPEAFLQANPAWTRKPSAPVVEIAFYSQTPLPAITPKDVTLRKSKDNVAYSSPISGLRVTTRRVRRPHARWDPADQCKRPARKPAGNFAFRIFPVEPFSAWPCPVFLPLKTAVFVWSNSPAGRISHRLIST